MNMIIHKQVCDPTRDPHDTHGNPDGTVCPGLGPKRQEEGPDGLLLLEPILRALDEPVAAWDTRVEMPAPQISFEEHICWMRMLVYPDADFSNLPGRIECAGCGATWGVHQEYTP